MRRSFLMIAIATQALGGLAFAHEIDKTSPYDPEVEDLTIRGEPPMLGIHWDREMHGSIQAKRKGKDPSMTYHGGKILPSTTVKAIFWGSSWGSYTGDKMTGIDSFYTGLNNSHYAATTTEYSGTNGKVGTNSTYQGHLVDTTAAAGGGSTSAILAEVCKAIGTPDPSGNGYYPVYTDVPRGHSGYCAYHSVGTCGKTQVQFAFFWKLDGDAGCDPQDSQAATGHSQGLAAIANVSGHEIAEAMTDPANPGAWYDSAGEENGDKCAWTFNVPNVMFSNGTKWKVQGEWSNAAYLAGTGYPNSSGERGCIDGH